MLSGSGLLFWLNAVMPDSQICNQMNSILAGFGNLGRAVADPKLGWFQFPPDMAANRLERMLWFTFERCDDRN